ncbi:MAG: SAM-dependent methyltransferase [Syntrophomonadaceae bacterium]|nr:SAM-dependent methyltransferase [Syntrophomonadaceae bacterium]
MGGVVSINGRLLAVARMVIPGQVVADIGSDHARLPIYLVEQGIVSWAIATEISQGPLSRAQAAIMLSPARDSIQPRLGDGLQALDWSEAATVIMAGMGADTICQILSHDWEKAASYRRFVFQPMSRPFVLRKALAEQGWPILDELLIRENKRIFIIICSQPENRPYKLSRLELDIGPRILKNRDHELYKPYLQQWMDRYQAVYKSLLQSNSPENRLLKEDYKHRIKALEVIMDAG